MTGHSQFVKAAPLEIAASVCLFLDLAILLSGEKLNSSEDLINYVF